MRVRFHLQKGKHYRHWQVIGQGFKAYYDPAKVNLIMRDCQLKNRRSTAQKIYEGKNKSVCAWIECDVLELGEKCEGKPISYNPRIKPHWQDDQGNDIDGHKFKTIVSNQCQLIVKES